MSGERIDDFPDHDRCRWDCEHLRTFGSKMTYLGHHCQKLSVATETLFFISPTKSPCLSVEEAKQMLAEAKDKDELAL